VRFFARDPLSTHNSAMELHQVVDRNPFIPTLRSLSLRLCIQHANHYVSLGDLPYVLVEPILQACTPNRLALLEDESPHLRADTQDLWQHHVSQKFHFQVEKQDNEDWRDLHERLKLDESARLEKATARLRAKNGKIKEEKMAKRIVVIEPRKAALVGERRKSNPFSSTVPRKVRGITAVHASSPKKGNSLMEKARRSTSLTKLNYAGAPRFSTPRPSGAKTSGGIRPGPAGGATKIRREPAPANNNTVFGGPPAENPKVRPPHKVLSDGKSGSIAASKSFFKAMSK
jgi:hypothetical protein